MKVIVDPDGRLREVGKKIPLDEVDAESIGMLLFRDSGVPDFRDALERAVRTPRFAQPLVPLRRERAGAAHRGEDHGHHGAVVAGDRRARRSGGGADGPAGLRYGDDEPKEPIPPVDREARTPLTRVRETAVRRLGQPADAVERGADGADVGQQAVEILDPDLAWPVAGGASGSGASRRTGRRCRSRPRRGPGGRPCGGRRRSPRRRPPGALHGVGGVEADRRELAHRHEAAHVDDQLVVAEAAPPLGDQDVGRTQGLRLLHRVPHVPRRDELARFRLRGRPVAAQAAIRSVWRTRKAGTWRQSTTSAATAAWPGSWTSRQEREPRLGLDPREHLEAGVDAGAAVGVAARAVRLVEGGLEDEGQAVALGDALRAPPRRRRRLPGSRGR